MPIYHNTNDTKVVYPGYNQNPGIGILVSTDGTYKEGLRTPNYIQRRTGTLPVNPYTISKQKMRCNAVEIDDKVYPYRRGSLALLGTPQPEVSIDAVAYERAYESFMGVLSGFDSSLGVTLAELPKTIDLVGSSAKRIAKALQSFRRRDITGAFNALGIDTVVNNSHKRDLIKSSKRSRKTPKAIEDFASNAWLETTYGWTPLLSEIDNAAKDLAKGWENHDSDIIARGTAKEKGSCKQPGRDSWVPSGALSEQIADYDVRYGFTARFRVIDSNLRTLSSLGLINPLEVAWELVPYSFVVDWFLPIGSWINNLDATAGIQFVSGSQSRKRKVQYAATLGAGNTVAGEVWLGEAHYQYSFESFDRSVLTSLPSSPPFRIQNLQQALGTKRSISSLALLTSVFRR